MSRTTDVIVAGSGVAGLMAAWAAANAKCRVRVISEGMGCLAISAGCVDLLGYDANHNPVVDPWEAMKTLPPEHPYSLLGPENVAKSLHNFGACVGGQGLAMRADKDENGDHRNVRMPTILGTLKPTWLFQADYDVEAMRKAKKVLVISVKGFRDCRPQLIISQLRRYPEWADKDFTPLVIPAPFSEKGRSLNALDLAHVADRSQGRDWLLATVKGLGKNYDIALLPPLLGARAASGIRKTMAETLGCPYVEMLSTPPGVGGLRIRNAMVGALDELGVEFYENAEIVRAEVKNNKCAALTTLSSGREITHHARAVVVATGGILNGGITLSPGKARESIFGLDLPVPENVDEWSDPEIFGKHLICGLGVRVNADLRALDKNGAPMLENVFFAGRTIGGYDYASEKSGHGVAVATGWRAGQLAAETARNESGDHQEKTAGADK